MSLLRKDCINAYIYPNVMSHSDKISNRTALSIILGVGLILWGIFWTFVMAYSISLQMERTYSYYDLSPSEESKFYLFSLLWSYHNSIIIGILSCVSGIGILVRKKFGWILALAVFIINSFHFIRLYTKITPNMEDKVLMSYSTIGLTVLCVICSVILVLPQMRQHFSIKKKEIVICISVIALVMIDRFAW